MVVKLRAGEPHHPIHDVRFPSSLNLSTLSRQTGCLKERREGGKGQILLLKISTISFYISIIIIILMSDHDQCPKNYCDGVLRQYFDDEQIYDILI